MKTTTFHRFLRRAALPALLACAGLGAHSARAQTPGPNGIAFWAQAVDDLWFEPFRWGAVLPHQAGPPDSMVTAHLSYNTPYTVSLLGQGPIGQCHHLSIGNPHATLRIAGSSTPGTLEVHGSQIDNEGTILVGGADALQDSRLVIAAHTNANGSGRIRLHKPASHNATIEAPGSAGWHLVNWPTHTIQGSGNITVSLQNDGTIEADVAGAELAFSGLHTVTNNGTMRARNGGHLRLARANGSNGFDQSPDGSIRIDADSSASLGNCGNRGLTGGQVFGPGPLVITCQGSPIEDVHLQASARVEVPDNLGLRIGPAGLRNDGIILTQGYVASRFGESATISGTGRLQLEDGGLTDIFGGAGYALVNAPGHTIGGVGTIALALTNQGEVLADRNGLTSGPSNLQMQTSAMANEGLMEARNGGSILLFATTLDQTLLGTLRAAADSSVVLYGGTVRGGVLATSGDGIIVMDGGASRLENIAISGGANVWVPCFRELELVGGIDNDGVITVDNAGCNPNFATVRGVGDVVIDGSGTVRLAASSTLGNAATLSAGTGLMTLGPAQTLTGFGRMAGNLRIEGALAPDQPFTPAGPVGALTLDGGAQLTLTDTSELRVDVLDPSSFDRIVGNGNVVLDGSLVLDIPPGFDSEGELVIDIITGNAVSGQFDQVVLPPGKRCGRADVVVLPDRARLILDVHLYCDGVDS